MHSYTAESIRNIAVLGHSGSGKTTLIEAALFKAGLIDRLGKASDGTLTLDFDPEEIKRKSSVNTAVAACPWKNSKINFVDTPGEFDFFGEVASALNVVESALIVVNARSGLEVGIEKSIRFMKKTALPYSFIVNRMDEEHADYERCLEELRERFGIGVIPFMIPIRENRKYIGFVDVLNQKAYKFQGKAVEPCEIPDSLKAETESYYEELLEQAAESDDELMLKYFEGEEITHEEMLQGMRKRIRNGFLHPVYSASAMDGRALEFVLDALVQDLPTAAEGKDPVFTDEEGNLLEIEGSEDGPLVALVFKTFVDPFVGRISYCRVFNGSLKNHATVYNLRVEQEERVSNLSYKIGKTSIAADSIQAGDIGAMTKLVHALTGDCLSTKAKPILIETLDPPSPCMTMAIFPVKQGEEDKVAQGLARLSEEDPNFNYGNNEETKQFLISGLGEVQLDVLVAKLKNKYKVEARLEAPRVAFREMIRKPVKAQGRHKKQTGGHGQFADVWIEFAPNPESETLVFEEKVFGGAVPKNFFPAVQKGLEEAVAQGVLAGYPVVHLKATLVDGSYHDVDSSEMAFKIAARLAYKNGLAQASPILMEPYSMMKIYVPEAQMGDVMGDINKRRGRILGIEHKDEMNIVQAECPTAEISYYATDLRSMTQGRGWYSVSFARYEQMPQPIADKVIAAAQVES